MLAADRSDGYLGHVRCSSQSYFWSEMAFLVVTVVKAELRDETVRNGVVELHLFLVESGIKKRVHEERVIRQWPVEEDDDEVASVAASVAQSTVGPTSQVAPARAAREGANSLPSRGVSLWLWQF